MNRNELPPDTPPPPRNLDGGPHNWMPYDNRLQFEVTNFLFRRNQMSAGDINFILGLWEASLAVHNDEPPFSNATDLYNTIDSTPLGDLAWESFSLQYNGTQPASNIPSWSTMSGFEIPKLWSRISCQTPILSLILIMRPFKSIPLMESIAFETSCLRTGPGIRQ